jgi:hypothetical protein
MTASGIRSYSRHENRNTIEEHFTVKNGNLISSIDEKRYFQMFNNDVTSMNNTFAETTLESTMIVIRAKLFCDGCPKVNILRQLVETQHCSS